MFWVLDKDTGLQAYAEGFFAVTENGRLIDVCDGWGCEGGGGSSSTPDNFIVVLGSPPKEAVQERTNHKECIFCDKKFKTAEALHDHCVAKHY